MPGGKREDEPGHRERSLPPETLGRKPQLPGRLAPAHTKQRSDRKYRAMEASTQRGRTGFPRDSKRRERALPHGGERRLRPAIFKYAPSGVCLLDGLTDQSIGEGPAAKRGWGETASRRPL